MVRTPGKRAGKTTTRLPDRGSARREHAARLELYGVLPTDAPTDVRTELELRDARGELVAEGDHALEVARTALENGSIVVVPGPGGFELACRADRADVIGRVRAALGVPSRPLTLLVRDLATARRCAELTPADERLLSAASAPVVVLPRAAHATIEAGLAPGLDDVALRLPASGLERELLRGPTLASLALAAGRPGSEPVTCSAAEARARLGPLADLLLQRPHDDEACCETSVLRAHETGHVFLRRSRGWVPGPVPLPLAAPEPLLALGSDSANTVTLGLGAFAFPSQHVGELEHECARALQLEALHGLEHRLHVTARTLVIESSAAGAACALGERLAGERAGRLLRVPHVLAHAAAVLGEHGRFPLSGRRAGAIVLDDSSRGSDGTDWGCEWLELDGDLGWRRLARGGWLPHAGLARAPHEPWRVAVAVLVRAGYASEIAELPLAALVPPAELGAAIEGARADVCPLANGASLLLDAAGALLGLGATNSYPRECAARLEALASRARSDAVPWSELRLDPGRAELPGAELLVALARRIQKRRSLAASAAGFHATLGSLAAQLALRVFAPEVDCIALGGSSFENRLLLGSLRSTLELAGRDVLLARALPPGDGGVSYGQCVLAAVARARGRTPTESGAGLA